MKKTYIFVFIYTILACFSIIRWDQAPVIYPDSKDYSNVARQILNKKAPSLHIRTPIYPLYLAPFLAINNLKMATYGAIILWGLAMIMLYRICLALFKNKWLSLILTMLLATDFGIINFLATILTESIAPALVIIWVFSRWIGEKERLSKKTVIVWLLIDIALIFLKPTFILLPIFYYLASGIILRRSLAKKLFLATANLILITSLCFYNLKTQNIFSISTVSDINMFGKMIQYGYLGEKENNAPPEVKETIAIYKKLEKKPDEPSDIINLMPNYLPKIKVVNKYFLKRKWQNFIVTTVKIMPSNINWPQSFYSNSSQTLTLMAKATSFFPEKVFPKIHKLNFTAIFGLTLIALFWLIKNKRRLIESEAYLIWLIWLTVGYILATSVVLGYSELGRLRVPVDTFLHLIIFYLFFLGIKFLKRKLLPR